MLVRWREIAEVVRGLLFLLTVGIVLPLLFYEQLGVVLGSIPLHVLT